MNSIVDVSGWAVYIPANVRQGKYYDFSHVPFFVEEQSGVNTEKRAVGWVLDNKDQVLEKLNRLKTHYRGGGKRIVGYPIAENIFFDRINVKAVKKQMIRRLT